MRCGLPPGPPGPPIIAQSPPGPPPPIGPRPPHGPANAAVPKLRPATVAAINKRLRSMFMFRFLWVVRLLRSLLDPLNVTGILPKEEFCNGLYRRMAFLTIAPLF
ncbi:MAG: hypothetical protein EKK68_04955 [Candidatus Competibacteraceae bacterium]|nr:MAG: hypothetical protein EKK68_04955 [Candidatus Competibacteraceae bacterium]